ncbi:acyltransferase family protein [Streptomyces sp. NPDC002588]|uniref:acyltransferase family protein n=1 Tax=Streptomyces sp. NPDC002588 TaxID=3154419 RepID=UPI00331EEDCB
MFHAVSSLVPSPRSPQNQNDQHHPAPDRSPGKPSARPAGQRDAFFDNAKYMAIVLVAVAHSWEPIKGDSRVLQGAYMVVYTFHMPAFIIISGYFSRSFDGSPARLKRLITGIAVPYVLFETAYSLFRRYGDHSPGQEISLLDPMYLTWFLVALFVWRLTTPLWKLIRFPLPLALVLAMLASLAPSIGKDLDLPRILQFLPYFVLGLSLKPEHFRLVRRRSVRIAAVPVFAFALVFSWWAVPRVKASWFYHSDSAQALGSPWWAGPVMQLAMFGCALLLTACFFSWVPGRTMWFTVLGAGTLYGYLLHGFVLKGTDYAGGFDHAWLHSAPGEVAVSVVVAGVVTLLCTRPVQRVFRFAVEPRMEWAFREDAVRVAQARERAKVPA